MTELPKNTQVPQCDKTAVKCRFFAQYWGQQVQRYENNNYKKVVNGFIETNLQDKDYLLLKPISKITDEDAISMYRGLERNYESANQFLEDYKSIGFLEQSEVDFLRSKGYAVPFMNYSVEDLVKMGWVQLV